MYGKFKTKLDAAYHGYIAWVQLFMQCVTWGLAPWMRIFLPELYCILCQSVDGKHCNPPLFIKHCSVEGLLSLLIRCGWLTDVSYIRIVGMT